MTVTTVTRNIQFGIVEGYRFFSLLDQSDTIKQVTTRLNAWGLHYKELCDDDRAVVVSETFDQDILDKLVTKYGLVTVAELNSYNQYISMLRTVVGELTRSVKSSTNGDNVTVYEYIQILGRSSGIGSSLPKIYYKPEGNSVLYFIGTPEVMLSLWNKYTNNAAMSLYALVDEGTQKIELSKEIADLCTRHEVLQSAGCLACPHKSNCVGHLLQADVSPIDVGINSLKNSISKLDIQLIPHSDCKDPHRGFSGKIDIRDLSLDKALLRYEISCERRKSIKLNTKFYKENCSNCCLKSICGSSKGYGTTREGIRNYCTGKLPEGTTLELTVDNYANMLKVMFTSLLTIAGKRLNIVTTAVDLVTEWVENECNYLPSHASYFISRFNRARKIDMAHQEFYVVPEQLIRLAQIFDINGSFDTWGNNWRSHCIGDWFEDATSSITSLLPSAHKSSGWFVILPTSVHIKETNPYYSPRHEYVDSKVMHSLLGINSSYRSKVFSTKESRLQMAIEFITQFLSPGQAYWYGPFGSSKAWVPSGVPSRWRWSWNDRMYKPEETAFPVRTPTDNLVTIFMMLREVSNDLDTLKLNHQLKEVILHG